MKREWAVGRRRTVTSDVLVDGEIVCFAPRELAKFIVNACNQYEDVLTLAKPEPRRDPYAEAPE